jgi:GPH family glycoside/pentoside/hexuronide:cation symporter
MAFQMAGALCLGFFAKLADKRILAVLLTLVTGVCYASFYFLPADNYALQIVINGIGAFAFGPSAALVWSMYADVADYGEVKYGRRSTALVYSASLFALKTGSMIAGSLLPFLLSAFGYVRNVEQTASAVFGITLAFSVFPGLFAGLKAVMLWIYPLTQQKVDEIEEALAKRNSERGDQQSFGQAGSLQEEL